ncbi:hypothetical protein JXB28_04380 [Candidatus Woesearchaeota archaeon]|nr:hypothetical protein [Candidatus Woesearchaeota archaeon]
MEKKITHGFTIDSHFKFNVDTNKELYEKHFLGYIRALNDVGAGRVVIHRPRQLGKNGRQRLDDMTSKLHAAGLKAVLYTGIFGQENMNSNPSLSSFVQRNAKGELLSYRSAGKKSAMMCPASPYIADVLAPKVIGTLKTAEFDSIFLDIPWMMKGGCYCSNCRDLREQGADNKRIVRYGLENFVYEMRKEFPAIPIGINSSAPGIYLHAWHGAEIDNFKELFQEYVTEWTPYQWGQKAEFAAKCIRAAKSRVEGYFYHAIVCKDKQGNIYSSEKLSSLFKVIVAEGALPWLCVNPTEEQLGKIGRAWQAAKS